MKSMRPSRVLRKLRAGQVVSCFKLNLSCARAAEIAAMAGFDCLWHCREHIGNDWSVLEQQIWAAKGYDVDVMARVSRGSSSDYVVPLELDAAGILVPHVLTAADARQIVRMTRFHPLGLRPVDGGNADGAYCNIHFNDYLRQANEERFVAIMIEDREAIEELDAIAAVEGIDILFFGPADFSQSIGAPGQWDHPEIARARKRVAEVCARHGKFAGCPATPETLPQWIELGYRFFAMGADVVGLSEYCRQMMAAFRAENI
jgi:4-hydroxy-2-oxoheptanedioate aldolase